MGADSDFARDVAPSLPPSPQLVLPEYGLHIGITLVLLLCGYWVSFIFNTPLLAYHIWR